MNTIPDYPALARLLTPLADPVRAVQMQAYMKNRFPFLGIPKPRLTAALKPHLKAAVREPIDWQKIDACWQAEAREYQYAALELLRAAQRQLTPTDLPRLHRLITTKSWWDTIDFLDRIVGGIALRYPEIHAVILDWSRDENIWLRRIAIGHQLLRKEKTDTELLAQILDNNLGQSEFFINKAIGWALRDYSKTNPEWVQGFIDRHRHKMAKLSLREAGKYLPPKAV